MNKPAITAILPCYNHASYLPRRIYSILNQTIRVSQIVFLDDASTDNSLQVAESLLSACGADVSFHRNSVNSGSAFAQWNKGILLSKNPIVWIAETDDTCELNLLEELYSSLVSNDAALSFSQSRYIDSDDVDLGSAISYVPANLRTSFNEDFALDGRLFASLFLSQRNLIPNASAVIFLRDAFVNAGLANNSMRYSGDWDMWLRICAESRVAYVAHELNRFRCHSSTTRFKGNTPTYSAESFACRLKALLINQRLSLDAVSLRWLIQQAVNSSVPGWSFVIMRLSINSFRDIVHSYSMLSNVPRVSAGAWFFIFVCLLFYRLAKLVPGFARA